MVGVGQLILLLVFCDLMAKVPRTSRIVALRLYQVHQTLDSLLSLVIFRAKISRRLVKCSRKSIQNTNIVSIPQSAELQTTWQVSSLDVASAAGVLNP